MKTQQTDPFGAKIEITNNEEKSMNRNASKPSMGIALCLSILQLFSTLPAHAAPGLPSSSAPVDLSAVKIQTDRNTQLSPNEIQKLRATNMSIEQSKSGTSDPSNTLNAVAGGKDGGGGGVVIQNPAGTDYVVNVLNDIRPDLLMLLKNICTDYNSVCVGLIGTNDNIFEKVKNYSIDIQIDRPCYDFNGLPTDGSVNSKPGTICISAKTVGKKVTTSTAYAQLISLLAHEYSHLMGYNEDQAIKFQNEVLFLAEMASLNGGYVVAQKFIQAANLMNKTLIDAQSFLQEQKLPVKMYYKLNESLQIDLFPYISYYFALDYKEAPKVKSILVRIWNLNLYACSQYELDLSVKSKCEKEYNSIFDSAGEIDAITFQEIYGDSSTIKPIGKVANLVTNPERFLSEITSLQVELDQMSTLINQQLQLRQ